MADRPLPSPFCSVLANRQNRHAPFERIRDCLPFGERFSHLGYRRTGWVYVYGVETTWRVLAGGAFTGTSEEIPSDVPRVGSPLRGDPLPIQPDPLRSAGADRDDKGVLVASPERTSPRDTRRVDEGADHLNLAGNARNSVESNGSPVTHSTTPFSAWQLRA